MSAAIADVRYSNGYGRAPRAAALDYEDRAAKELLQHLFKRSHLPKCPEVVGLQQKRCLVFTCDRCNDELSIVTGELECSRDCSSLPDVEHRKHFTI